MRQRVPTKSYKSTHRSVVEPLVLILMGVSASGKTSVGRSLATQLGWAFLDADDLHSPSAIAKMSSGDGLDSGDRAPWLERVRACVASAVGSQIRTVVACSALREAYREVLTAGLPEVAVAYLHVEREALLKRLQERDLHFAKADILESQIKALEPPPEWPRFESEGGPEKTARAIAAHFNLSA